MLIKNFLPESGLTVIYGRPVEFQSHVADEIAFTVASGANLFNDPALAVSRSGEVVILADGPPSAFHDRAIAWRMAREVPVGRKLGVIPINIRELVSEGDVSQLLVARLKARPPALLVLTACTTDMIGLCGIAGQRDFGVARAVQEQIGCAVLIAGHSGAMGWAHDLAKKCDALWRCEHLGQDRLRLSHDDRVFRLKGASASVFGVTTGLSSTLIFQSEVQTV